MAEPTDTEDMAEEEGEATEDVETITVKLPNGQKLLMISPFDDEGDVPWLVPKDERDLDYFEIPWNAAADENYRTSMKGNLIVLRDRMLRNLWVFENGNPGVPNSHFIYKGRFDAFNGKHIINRLLSNKPPETAKTATKSVPEKSEGLRVANELQQVEAKLPSPQWTTSKHKKLTALIERLEVFSEEGIVNPALQWLNSKIRAREKRIIEKKKARELQSSQDHGSVQADELSEEGLVETEEYPDPTPSEHVVSELIPESFYADSTFDFRKARKLFREIQDREEYERRKRKRRRRLAAARLIKQLADRMEMEWGRINPDYLEAVKDLKVRNIKRHIMNWEPKIILPSGSSPREDQESTNAYLNRPDVKIQTYLEHIENPNQLPFMAITSFEINCKLPFWVEEQKMAADTVMLNMYIRESALTRGWVNSPFYQLCINTGLILDGSKRSDFLRRNSFLKSADYELKSVQFERLIDNGAFSEEKMQELVALGVTEQDPFVKDLMEFLSDRRQWQATVGGELEQNLEENPDMYKNVLPSSGTVKRHLLNNLGEEEAEFDNEEEEEEEVGELQEKVKFLVRRLLYDMCFNRDPRLRRWDAQRSHDDAELRETRMKQLSGELRTEMSDDKLKTLFGQHLFGTVWVHPNNFKKALELSNIVTAAEIKAKKGEFEEFLVKWKKEWKKLKRDTIKKALHQFMKRRYAQEHDEKKMLVRAFRKRISKYETSGCIPQLFLKAFVNKKEKDSRLSFLEKMRDTLQKHLESDRKTLKEFIAFLRNVVTISKRETVDKENLIRTKSGIEEEDVEEEEEDVRGKKKVKRVEAKTEEKKEFVLEYNQNYLGDEKETSHSMKGPMFVDPELKGMDEKAVVELYKQHQVPIKRQINASNLLLNWYSEDFNHFDDFLPDYYLQTGGFKKQHFLTLSRYIDHLNLTQAADSNQIQTTTKMERFVCHSNKKFQVPICIEVREVTNEDLEVNQNERSEKFEDRTDGPLIESPYFSSKLLDVWQSRINAPIKSKTAESPEKDPSELGDIRRKAMNRSANISVGRSGASSYYKDERHTADLSEEELSGESDKDLTKYELTLEDFLKPSGDDLPSPKLGLYNSPTTEVRRKVVRPRKISRRYAEHRSFLKYIDMDKFFQDPETMKLWRMAASGKLWRKVGTLEEDRMAMRRVSRNLWAWDAFEKGITSEEIKYQREVLKFISKHLFRKPNSSREKTDKLNKNMFEEYKPSLVYEGQIQNANILKNGVPPTANLTIFSSVLPLEGYNPTLNQKIEDRKLFRVLESCGTLIFDITRSRQDMYECSWYLRKLYLKMKKLDKSNTSLPSKDSAVLNDKKVSSKKSRIEPEAQVTKLSDLRPPQRIILITNFLSWANSPDDVKDSLNEKNFYKRKPHSDYGDYYTFENMVYRIGRRKPFNIQATIIYTGLPFGFEEDGLSYLFKMAYQNKREIPIYGPGTNNPPMIHIQDLCEVVTNVMENPSPPLLVFAAQDIGSTLEKRIFNVASQISYPHVRAQPDATYEWNNVFPKSVHDMLQLNFTVAQMDNSSVLNKPHLANPFSTEEDDYRLMKEFRDARGLVAKTVLLLGAPTQMKLDVAKAISVFYNVPLITRRNIHSECVKVVQLLGEMKTLRKNYEQNPEEEGEKEEDVKRPEYSMEEMKQAVENQNSDVNRNWLLVCLRYLLRTVRYKKLGYILCDVPISESDAAFLFNNPLRRREPRRFEDVSAYVHTPNKVIFIEPDCDIIHDCCVQSSDKVLEDDWNDFWDHHYAKDDASVFFTKRLRKVHRVKMNDEFFFEKIIEIIGPPAQPDGEPMFDRLLSLLNDIRLKRSENKKGIERASKFFDAMQHNGLDLAAGLTHQPLPILKELASVDYKTTLYPYYFCTRPLTSKQRAIRSKAGPYREVRRKWAKKSSFFDQMPTGGDQAMWKRARKFWAPQEKTKDYIMQFDRTNI